MIELESALARPAQRPKATSLPVWMTAVFVLTLVLGALAFRHPAALGRGQAMPLDRAIFTAVNAITLTGFTQAEPASAYAEPGQAGLLVMMVVGSLFTLIMSGIALVRILHLPWSEHQLLGAGFLLLAGAAGIGAAGLASSSTDRFTGVFHAVSAFSNCGLALEDALHADAWTTHVLLLPLAFGGGLGLVVLIDLFTCLFRPSQRLMPFSRSAIALSAGIYLLGVFALFLLNGPYDQSSDAAQGLARASAASVNARTLGLALINLDVFSRASQWVLLGIMCLGVTPGGAGGGLGTVTLETLSRGTGRALRGQKTTPAFGFALLWLWCLMGVVILVTLALLALEPQMPFDRILALAVGAVTTAGWSHEPVSLTGGGLHVLSAAMLVGRILPLWLLWKTANSAAISRPSGCDA